MEPSRASTPSAARGAGHLGVSTSRAKAARKERASPSPMAVRALSIPAWERPSGEGPGGDPRLLLQPLGQLGQVLQGEATVILSRSAQDQQARLFFLERSQQL